VILPALVVAEEVGIPLPAVEAPDGTVLAMSESALSTMDR
jgi:hypothetical protein